jgi:hypothetical protein
MKKIIAAALASGAFVLSGCGTGGYGTVGPVNLTMANGNPTGSTNPSQKAASTALYQPLAAIMPYPYDAWFGGSTDGTLNIQPANQARPAQDAVNGLDGFSTTAAIRERFNGPIDAASLATPGAVVVVHINTTNAPSATVPAKAPVPPPTGKFIPLAGCVPGPNCTAALPFNFDYMVAPAAEDPTVLEITPLKPLNASTCLPPPPNSPCQGPNGGLGEAYMVLLTKAITVQGVPAVPDTDYKNFQAALTAGGQTCPSITEASLNALCQLSGAHLALAQALLKVNPADVVVSFSFSTLSTLDTLLAAASEASAIPQTLNVSPALLAPTVPATTGPPIVTGGKGYADIWVGVLTLPYYLATATPDPTAPDTAFWHASAAMAPDMTSTLTTRFNPVPVPTVAHLQVPVLMTVPNGTAPGAPGQPPPGPPWAVVIFEHGLTADRTNLLALGDSLALGGMVGIAIDLPLHGRTVPYNASDPTTVFYASSANPWYKPLGLPASGSIERTFDLDTLNKAAGLPGLDSSGSHYVALGSPLTLRDNMRESSVDLVTLALSLAKMTAPAPFTAPPINPTNLHYMGHSQGAIIGTGFLAAMPANAILSATLANPGGKFVYLGFESPTFGPPAKAALATASQGLLTPGTSAFAQYAIDTQSVVDSGDPWNFIGPAVAQHPIHLIQVVGSTPQPAGCTPNSPPPTWCTDQVVPNDATERLITAGGFTPAHPPGASGAMLHRFVSFTEGVHSSFLSPAASVAVTTEMQLEAISFTGQAIPAVGIPTTPPGTSLVVANPAVVQ